MKILLRLFLFTLLISSFIYAQNIPDDYSNAMSAFSNGNYSKAYELFTAFSSNYNVTDELSSTAKYYLAESLLRLGNKSAAIPQFENFKAKYEWSGFMDDVLNKLGSLYFEEGQYTKSRINFQLLIKNFPQSEYYGSALFFIGESFTRENQLDEAIKFYDESIASKKNNKYLAQSIYSLANVYEKIKDYKQAVTYYDQLLTYHNQSNLTPYAQVRIGECYFRLKDYDNAILELTDPMINDLPEDVRLEAKYILANSYYKLREFEDAEKNFKDIIGINPAWDLIKHVRYDLAWTYFQQGKYNESFKLFNLLSQNGTDSIAINSLFWSGESKRYAGDESEANLIFQNFLSRYPDNSLVSNVQYNIGVSSYGKSKVNVSEEFLTKSANSDNEAVKAKAQTVLGEIKLNKSEYIQARNYFERTLALNNLNLDVRSRALLGLGISLYYLNQYDGALQNLLELDSKSEKFESDKVSFYIAESYFALKDYSKSLKYYNKVNPDNKELNSQMLFGKGYAYYNLKDFLNASSNFAEFVKRYSDSKNYVDAKLRLADSYYGIKKYSDAGKIYKEIFLADNQSRSNDYAYYQYAQALYKAGNSDEAIKEFTALQERFPNSKYVTESQYIIGWIYFQKGNFQQSITSNRVLLNRYPGSPIVPISYNSIANSFFNLGSYDSAIAYYNKVITEFPSSNYVFDAVSGTIDAYVAANTIDRAIEFIDTYLAQNPAISFSDQILAKKGEIYYSLGQYENAKNSYKEFIRQYPKSPLLGEAYYWIGKSASNLKQNEEALYNFNIVANSYLNTESGVAAILEMGRIHTELKNYDAAIYVYKIAIDKLPPQSQKIPEIMYSRAVVYVSKGDINAAYGDFSYIIQYYDGTIFAANSKFEIGVLELARQNFENSDMLFKELAENRVDDLGAKAQYYLGLSLYEQGKIDDAITALVRVRSVFPGYDEWLTRSFLKLGECYEKKNDTQKAREMYRTVLNRHNGDNYGEEAQNKLRKLK